MCFTVLFCIFGPLRATTHFSGLSLVRGECTTAVQAGGEEEREEKEKTGRASSIINRTSHKG